jgi:hypothetical protein
MNDKSAMRFRSEGPLSTPFSPVLRSAMGFKSRPAGIDAIADQPS